MKINIFFCVMLVLVATHKHFAQLKLTWEHKNVQSDASFRGICAVNEDIVWVCGSKGTVLKTIDSGNNWEKIIVTEGERLDFRDVHAFDDKTAIIMSAGQGSKSKIFKTIDGGLTWNIVHYDTHKDAFFNAISFWNKQYGILAGDPIDRQLYIALTRDGGDTWTKLHHSHLPKTFTEEYSFAASGTHLRVMGEKQAWIGTGGKSARVFYTTDRGKSWKISDTPMMQGKSSTGIFSIKFKNPNYGIAVGGDYADTNNATNTVIVSKDKGKTWTLVPTHMEYRSCIDYVDGLFIAVGSHGWSYSLDSGINWSHSDEEGFHTLSIGGSKDAIWVAGANGKVARLHIGK